MILIDPLVSLPEAKLQLNETGSVHDQIISSLTEQATGIIVEYIDDSTLTTWTQATVPAPVHAAILWQVTWMFQHRGDELDTSGIAPGIDALLKRTRRIPIA